MPKCGCAGGACSCSITPGSGIQVTGTGNASAPFVVSVAPLQDELLVGSAGPLDLSSLSGYTAATVQLEANATSVVLPLAGSRVDLLIIQGAGGSKTITWPGTVLFPGGVDPVLATAAGAIDWITLISTGGIWAGVKTGGALA